MKNYFNTLKFREQLKELKKCRFMKKYEFLQGIKHLKNKKIVIVGCGSQGLNQGLNMRDSGLNIAFALRKNSIKEKRKSWMQAVENKFQVGTYLDLIPQADLVINLTPDKEHSAVIKELQPLMKKNSVLGYSHGFNIVEMGEQIRKDITVIMVAPKCPGTEVREEYKRGFGVPTLIAVHSENDCKNQGLDIAKAWAVSLGSDKAGVLESSFIAEVKSDLMGEQTVLCGLLQTASLVLYKHLISKNYDPIYSGKLIQHGWEIICEALKLGGITLMLDKLSNSSKLRVLQLADQLKAIFTPLFKEHMDNILSGKFSEQLMNDWKNKNSNLLKWRKEIQCSEFEKAEKFEVNLLEENVFKHGILMIAFIKAGVELAFETMIESGIIAESAYYESLHELPLIANTISRKRLYEMNIVISDTAEFGSYLFTNSALPLLEKFMLNINSTDIGNIITDKYIDNITLYKINHSIRNHPIEIVGQKLRKYMEHCKMNSIKK